MDMFLQQILNGLTLGYGILHLPNFAHGALYMAGAFVCLQLMTRTQ